MNVNDAVNNIGAEAFGQSLVAQDFALGIIFEVPIALETPLHDLAEFGRKCLMVEEVMYA